MHIPHLGQFPRPPTHLEAPQAPTLPPSSFSSQSQGRHWHLCRPRGDHTLGREAIRPDQLGRLPRVALGPI